MVDVALAGLRRGMSAAERWPIIQAVVEHLHGPIVPEDGMDVGLLARVPMPEPLRWWYGWAGNRREILEGYNHWMYPLAQYCTRGGLQIEDGRVIFQYEQQGVYDWATALSGDDPPVQRRMRMVKDGWGPWMAEGMTLSEHILASVIFEAAMCRMPYIASRFFMDDEMAAAVLQPLRLLELGPWTWTETRFYAARGAFAFFQPANAACFFIGARTVEPLRYIEAFADPEWEFHAP